MLLAVPTTLKTANTPSPSCRPARRCSGACGRVVLVVLVLDLDLVLLAGDLDAALLVHHRRSRPCSRSRSRRTPRWPDWGKLETSLMVSPSMPPVPVSGQSAAVDGDAAPPPSPARRRRSDGAVGVVARPPQAAATSASARRSATGCDRSDRDMDPPGSCAVRTPGGRPSSGLSHRVRPSTVASRRGCRPRSPSGSTKTMRIRAMPRSAGDRISLPSMRSSVRRSRTSNAPRAGPRIVARRR